MVSVCRNGDSRVYDIEIITIRFDRQRRDRDHVIAAYRAYREKEMPNLLHEQPYN